MPGHEVPVERKPDLRGWVLLAAFVVFAILSIIFVSVFFERGAFEFPQVLLLMGVNYLFLIFIPYYGWRSIGIKPDFLGIDRRSFKKSLVACVIAFVLAGVWQIVLGGIQGVNLVPDRPVVLYVFIIFFLCLLLPFWDWRISAKIGIPAGLIALAAWSIQMYLYPVGDEDLMETLTGASGPFWNLAIVTILVGVFVPFAEEWFFRGFVLNYFLKNNNAFFAVIVTAALFGLAHSGSLSIVPLTLFAIPLGMLTIWSGSIYPAIFAHAGLNLSAMVLVWMNVLSK